MLIVFEGVDAAGKSTVCEHYLKALVGCEISCRLLSFPGKKPGTLGELVYQLHHVPQSKGDERLSPASLQALHIAAHLDAIETIIVPSLENGDTVILDRYWWSTWVYGIVSGADPKVLESLIEAERLAWGSWQPDILFHVIRSSPLREEPADIWERLCREYDALANRESDRYNVCELNNEGVLESTVADALKLSHGF